jgi:hypothetical protein
MEILWRFWCVAFLVRGVGAWRSVRGRLDVFQMRRAAATI